jgi:DNA-binding beta-propeller fold protein YncE
VRIQAVNRRDFLAAAVAAPFALTAAPALARSAGGTPIALVTADLESRVVAFDLASGRVARHISTLAGPKSIETVGNGTTAVVAHTKEGAVSLVDIATLRVRAVLRAFTEPRYTAAGPDGRYAHVTDAGRGELVTIDLRHDRVVHRLVVGAHARHLSLDPMTMTLWTALGFSAPALSVIDLAEPARPRLVGRVVPPFPAHDVVFTPDGSRVWVSSGTEQRLVVYDARTRRPLFQLPAGKAPQHITFTTRAAYVTSDDAVGVHRLRDGKLLRTTPVPAGSYNVTQGWGRVFTPSLERGTLAVLDARGRLLAHPAVARAAHDACFVVTA